MGRILSTEDDSYSFVTSKLYPCACWGCSPSTDALLMIPFLTAKLSTSSFNTLPSFPVPHTSFISIPYCFARLLTAGVDGTPARFAFSGLGSSEFALAESLEAAVANTDSLSNIWSESGDFALFESPIGREGNADSSTDIFRRVSPTWNFNQQNPSSYITI